MLSERKDETPVQLCQVETQYAAFADTLKPLQLESKTQAGPALISCCRNLRRTTGRDDSEDLVSVYTQFLINFSLVSWIASFQEGTNAREKRLTRGN